MMEASALMRTSKPTLNDLYPAVCHVRDPREDLWRLPFDMKIIVSFAHLRY
jgi:hypothetical protein